MRFICGLVGIILGAAFGGAAAVLIASAYPDGVDVIIAVGWFLAGLLAGAIAGPVISQVVWLRARAARSRGASQARLWLGLACWTAGPILLTLAMLWASTFLGPKPPPSDAAMLGNFYRHRAAFDQLAQVCATDKERSQATDSAYNSSSEEPIAVSMGKAGQYDDLLRVAGVADGEWQTWQAGRDEADFHVWTARRDYTDPGIEKGYAYLTHQPAEFVSRLDGYAGRPIRDGDYDGIDWVGTAYRHIIGPWYLYYSFDNDKFP